jgi:hypothetical protein
MMNLYLGIIGMILILVAFILDEFYKNFNQDTVYYNLVNIFGSGLLTYYAYTISSLPFLLLNLVWLIVAIIKLAKIVKK